MHIPFVRPFLTGREIEYLADSLSSGHLAGDGPFTMHCNGWIEERLQCRKALLTHSCTGALEMAAILAELQQGDEVIMPSFSFVSTANAVVLRGAVPVFVDIRADTLNLDESKIEAAITSRTRAIVPVHYAGVGCEMDAIMDIAARHGLLVIEDAAQALTSTYRDRPLGAIGHMGALSFHETKNLVSGEGGALIIQDERVLPRAEIIREKGTNRKQFLHGQVDKYSWVDVGSSFLPSDLLAAVLWAQLQGADTIMVRRHTLWSGYHAAFAELEASGRIRRPIVPDHCGHNAHMYYLLLRDPADRTRFIAALKELGIQTVFHYIPLHDAPAGRKYGRSDGELPVTRHVADRLVRLPLWAGLEDRVLEVIDAVTATLAN